MAKTRNPVRLAILTTHPIQYASPLFRRLAREPDIGLTVLYASDISLRDHADPGFGRRIAWDVPLLEGYASEFLPAWGGTGEVTFWRPFSRGLARRLRKERFDWLMVHGYSRPVHWLAILLARARGVRVLVRDEATAVSRRRGPFKRALKRLFFAALGRLADGFLAIGTLNKAYYEQQGIASAKIFLTPYAVDNEFFRKADPERAARLRQDLGIPATAPVILYASKLQHRKHADHLLDAFLRLRLRTLPRDAHLVLAGDGELLPRLRAMAKDVPEVHFLGFKSQHELSDCYAMCDVFVLPSSFETWGLVVNEAMNLGKAVVVSDQVGCGPDLVRHGVNGFVFPVGDIEALTGHLEAICRDPALSRRMGEASLKIISEWDFEADLHGFRQALGLAGATVKSNATD